MTKKQCQNKSEYYVSNKDLLAELCKWRDSAENPNDRIISEALGSMMYKIAKHLTNHISFRGYSDELKQDMVSYGCYKAIIGLKNFNFEYKNPFAYLTQIFWNADVTVCAKYYKYKNGMKHYMIDAVNEVANSTIGAAKSTYLVQIQKSLQSFLDEFEQEEKQHAGSSDSDDAADSQSTAADDKLDDQLDDKDE